MLNHAVALAGPAVIVVYVDTHVILQLVDSDRSSCLSSSTVTMYTLPKDLTVLN